MKLTSHRYSLFTLFVILASCSGQPAALPTETPVPTTASPAPVPTSTLMLLTLTPSPLPTQLTSSFMTPDSSQVERWKEYEKALGLKLLPPNSLRGEVLCEWEILGRSNQEIYVWAFCQSPPYSEGLPASIASIPAVVHLAVDESVQSVEIPGSGTAYDRDVRKMFPIDVQEKIFSHSINTRRMEAHIDSRRENPEPPLIVLSATAIP